MIFVVLALLGPVATLAGVYPVHRQDFRWDQESAPLPYRTYPERTNGIYRVSRQEFGQPFAFSPQQRFDTSFQPASQLDYSENQYWYPHSNVYNYQNSEPKSVPAVPVSKATYMPKLFVPAASQVFNTKIEKTNRDNMIPVPSFGQMPSVRPVLSAPWATDPPAPATDDDGVLPPVPGSISEGEPLSPLTDYSKQVSRPGSTIKYHAINDDVEISDEQKDLLAAFFSTLKPINDKDEPASRSSRLRRYIDWSPMPWDDVPVVDEPNSIMFESEIANRMWKKYLVRLHRYQRLRNYQFNSYKPQFDPIRDFIETARINSEIEDMYQPPYYYLVPGEVFDNPSGVPQDALSFHTINDNPTSLYEDTLTETSQSTNLFNPPYQAVKNEIFTNGEPISDSEEIACHYKSVSDAAREAETTTKVEEESTVLDNVSAGEFSTDPSTTDCICDQEVTTEMSSEKPIEEQTESHDPEITTEGIEESEKHTIASLDYLHNLDLQTLDQILRELKKNMKDLKDAEISTEATERALIDGSETLSVTDDSIEVTETLSATDETSTNVYIGIPPDSYDEETFVHPKTFSDVPEEVSTTTSEEPTFSASENSEEWFPETTTVTTTSTSTSVDVNLPDSYDEETLFVHLSPEDVVMTGTTFFNVEPTFPVSENSEESYSEMTTVTTTTTAAVNVTEIVSNSEEEDDVKATQMFDIVPQDDEIVSKPFVSMVLRAVNDESQQSEESINKKFIKTLEQVFIQHPHGL